MKLAFAQIVRFKGEAGCINQEGINYFICKFLGIINIIYWLGIVGGIITLVYSAILYMANPGKGIKEEFPLIILGLVLIISAFTIQVLVFAFLK